MTSKIKIQDVEKFIFWRKSQISQKTGKPISNDVINREILTLNKIFNRRIDAELSGINPVLNIKRLPANNPTFHVITAQEEIAYLFA